MSTTLTTEQAAYVEQLAERIRELDARHVSFDRFTEELTSDGVVIGHTDDGIRLLHLDNRVVLTITEDRQIIVR